MNIIKAIQVSCQCTADEARNYLQGELDNLADLASEGSLEMDDLDNACFVLGIDLDYVETLISMSCGVVV